VTLDEGQTGFVYALANRTYAGPRAPVWDAAVTLLREGHLKTRPATTTSALATAYTVVSTIFTSGSVTSAGDVLSMNFLMDRDAEHWARDLSALKAEVGTCDTTSAIVPGSALSGDFTWRCEHGRVKRALLLAPTRKPLIQALSVTRVTP
jgi:serine-type D-Ala-D-Ala carboxypeptidase/endopeptidase